MIRGKKYLSDSMGKNKESRKAGKDPKPIIPDFLPSLFEIFYTEGNEGASRCGLASLLPFFGKRFENEELEHPSFSLLPSVQFLQLRLFEQELTEETEGLRAKLFTSHL